LLLPRPPKKGDKQADSNLTQDGPVVLSPQRKVRRVTLNQEGSAGTLELENDEHQTRGTKLTGDPGAQGSRAPMSIDVGAIFGTKPFSRTPLKR
jgi:cyclin-dependent kinase 7